MSQAFNCSSQNPSNRPLRRSRDRAPPIPDAERRGPAEKAGEHVHLAPLALADAVGEPCAGASMSSPRVDTHRRAVQTRAQARSALKLAGDRIVNSRELETSVDFERDRHAEQREPVREFVVLSSGSMIHRHRAPAVFARPAPASSPSTACDGIEPRSAAETPARRRRRPVTRSMGPFSGPADPVENARWVARRTAPLRPPWRGASDRGPISGIGRDGSRELLAHADHHAAFGPPRNRDVVHEAAHEENTAAARFEDVFGVERVGHPSGSKPSPSSSTCTENSPAGCWG